MTRSILLAGALVMAGAHGAAGQGNCPSGIARDGVWLGFADRTVLSRVLSDGRIHEMEFARDGSYLYAYLTLPIGLVVEAWGLENGVSPRDEHESVSYAGTPLPMPAPAQGARFDGIETARYADGSAARATVNLSVGHPRPVMIGGCGYTGLPVEVTRIEIGGATAQRDSMMHLAELGLTIYLGFSEGDAPPMRDLPETISLAPPVAEGGADAAIAPPPLPGGVTPPPEK